MSNFSRVGLEALLTPDTELYRSWLGTGKDRIGPTFGGSERVWRLPRGSFLSVEACSSAPFGTWAKKNAISSRLKL